MTLPAPAAPARRGSRCRRRSELADEFPDGVFWVSLAALATRARPPNDREALGPLVRRRQRRARAARARQLRAPRRRGRRRLATCCRGCPDLKVLATSRAPLHAARRSTSTGRAPRRATRRSSSSPRALRPSGRTPSPGRSGRGDLPAARRPAAGARAGRGHARCVCRQEALLERLDHRLALLAARPRDRPERQRTLRATIEWSYDLLTPAEQAAVCAARGLRGRLHARSGRGGLRRDLDALDSLVEKSLAAGVRTSASRCWRRSASLRASACRSRTRPKQCEDVDADFFVALAGQAEEGWRGPDQPAWVDRLDAEQHNIRAALGLVGGDRRHRRSVLALVVGMASFWYDAWELARGEPLVRPGARPDSRRADGRSSEGPAGRQHVRGSPRRSRALEGVQRQRAWRSPASSKIRRSSDAALSALGVSTMMLRRRRAGARAVRGGCSPPPWLGAALQSRARARKSGATSSSRRIRHARSRLLEEAVALHREIGTEHGLPHCLYTLAFLRFRAGREREAEAGAREAVVVSHGTGDVRYAVFSLFLVGSIEARRGDLEVSASLLGAAEAERARIGLSLDPSPGEELEIVHERPRRDASGARACGVSGGVSTRAARSHSTTPSSSQSGDTRRGAAGLGRDAKGAAGAAPFPLPKMLPLSSTRHRRCR